MMPNFTYYECLLTYLEGVAQELGISTARDVACCKHKSCDECVYDAKLYAPYPNRSEDLP